MRPDQRWFPTNRTERAAWFENFARNFPAYAATLGFSAAETDAVVADNAVVQFVTRSVTSVETYRAAVLGFQENVLLGKNDRSMPHLPVAPDLDPPPMVARGIFERLERTVRRIRAQPAYTDAIGAMLGIIPSRSGLTLAAMAGHTPPIKTLNAKSGYSFEIGTVRAGFDQFQVEVRRAGSQDWELAATATTSPVEVRIAPTTPGQAELINIRIRMIRKNKPTGEYSNTAQLALIP